jgi:dihydropteroate synthase
VSVLSNKLIAGVVNITPDSFSDGGQYNSLESAIEHIDSLFRGGANLVDLGAESTRPGAKPISSDEEWGRLFPIIQQLKNSKHLDHISVDTKNNETALKAIESGISFINFVTGVPSRSVLEALSQLPNPRLIAMHMHRTPLDMQLAPLTATNVLEQVEACFEIYSEKLQHYSNIKAWFDPGFGFGKTDAASFKMMQKLPFWSQKWSLAGGVSRKSVFGRLLGIETPQDRDAVSKVAECGLWLAGVQIVRTHDVQTLSNIRSMMTAEM